MRRLGNLLASASRPKSLLCFALVGVSVWAAGIGLVPMGPRPSEAVEGRLVTEGKGPSAYDREITRRVSKMMAAEHLTKHALDDEISRRGLDQFLKSLDPRKLYFYQSDIDEFNQRRNDLDNMAANGDLTFAYTVFNRLLKRLDERMVVVRQLLEMPLDFEADDVLVIDPDKLTYFNSPDEARARWIKHLKYEVLVLKSDKSNKEDIHSRLKRRYETIAKQLRQTDSNQLLETFVSSLTSSFDPHSMYMAPAKAKDFEIQIGLQLEGIGAQLKPVDGYTVIDKLLAGGPAEKQGQLKAGDRILSVGQGAEGPVVDVADMKLTDVVDLIRGRAGTVVRLSALPETGGEPKTIKIVRGKIELKDQAARSAIIEEGKKADGSPFKLGVINLPTFYEDMRGRREGNEDYKSCSRDVRRLLEDFNKQGVDAVVLDLRGNGGGSLTEAIALTGLFIERGPIVQTKDTDGRISQSNDEDPGIVWRGPLVVMIDKFSASASEILAGAVQDYKRGIVVGDSATHGKGTVQVMVDIGQQLFRQITNPPDLGQLKLTMSQFYRPSGDSTQKRGVLSDLVLPSLTDHIDSSESDLDYPVEFDKVPPANFRRFSDVSDNAITQLKERSTQRVQQSADFAKLNKSIQRYEERKAKMEVPLNEKKYIARREEFDAEKEEEKIYEDQARGAPEVFKRDYYNNEVLAITLDYLRLLGKDKVAAR